MCTSYASHKKISLPRAFYPLQIHCCNHQGLAPFISQYSNQTCTKKFIQMQFSDNIQRRRRRRRKKEKSWKEREREKIPLTLTRKLSSVVS